jgi:hypothetical protein
VNLIEVDVTGAEAFESGVDDVEDLAAGGTDVVAAGAGAAKDLSGDDDVLECDSQVLSV